MSLAFSSLRSHFFKHLTSSKTATTFFSFRRRFHFSRPSISSFLSAKAAQKQQQSTAVIYPTLNGSTVSIDDSFTSPYLFVRISCQRHVADVLSESLMCFGASSTTIDEQDSDQIWISSTFAVSQDVKDCISRAADSVGLKEIPNYEVEIYDRTDWIKQTQQTWW